MKWIAPHGATTSTERYRNAQPTIAGSNPDAKFFNTVLDELLAVIVAANMTPTDANLHQIADAIVYLTERAATSGVTKGAYWFGKTTANFTVPNPTLAEQNYIDFTTLKTYSAKSDLSGWTQTGTFVPPAGIDFTILITSKFWDIPEQDGQQGGEAKYNHTNQVWAYWPKIISFRDAALTGTPTTPIPAASDSTSSTTIVPAGWVNDPNKSTNVVHRSGTETISGDKTFSGTVKAPTISSVSDNSTKVATTAFVTKVLGAVYPVGSIYIGTQSTCPMATLISGSIWTVVATKIVVATGNSIPVVGDGTPLGFDYNGNKAKIYAHNESLGSVNGWVRAMVNGSYTSVGNLAVSTDATQSGIIADVSNATITVNVWKRTA